MEENNSITTEQKGPKSINPLLGLVIIALIFIVVAGIVLIKAGEKENNTNNLVSTTPSANINFNQATSSPEVKTTTEKVIEVKAGSFYFIPNEIRVKKGEAVKIVLSVQDSMHNFALDEFNVIMPVTRAGQTNEVSFTADKTGTFEYYCALANHRKMGQVGKLVVEK